MKDKERRSKRLASNKKGVRTINDQAPKSGKENSTTPRMSRHPHCILRRVLSSVKGDT